MNPSFVYFDLGNVLCFFDHDRSCRQMAEVVGCDAATIRKLVYESDLEHQYETGLIDNRQFVDEISRGVGRSLDVDQMLRAASDMFEPNEAILPVLEMIKQKGIPMGLLSNTCWAHWTWIVKQNYRVVQEWFDPILLSYELRCMKPATEIYAKATEQCGFPAKDIFFTDDRADNIEAASEFGWQTYQFVRATDLFEIVQAWN